ncbi:hypothetical protein EV652_101452 [Kribbella steppae]|uniref:Uncharacterized protein n=1 Tax=Kribbella steppae TaxID=2512223 RepID=A0A4V2S172_9ACTN|nr:hypothetical protein [Kribbella steppae]TCO35570.1 hypothetical protein EV652_101452 [Kribbella steppae]
MGASGPRSFDPVVVGNRETDAWTAYYLHDWRRFLVASVGLVGAAFGMTPRRTVLGAWFVLRANQVWAPYPDNEPDAARAYMRRFFELVVQEHGLDLDPAQAARLEVEWWRIHRDGPEEQLEDALVDLYSYAYDAKREAIRPAARKRVEAMDLSDRWVKAGCRRDDPLLAGERRALVASYAALRTAVEVRPDRP